jgi:hypothetical protein
MIMMMMMWMMMMAAMDNNDRCLSYRLPSFNTYVLSCELITPSLAVNLEIIGSECTEAGSFSRLFRLSLRLHLHNFVRSACYIYTRRFIAFLYAGIFYSI